MSRLSLALILLVFITAMIGTHYFCIALVSVGGWPAAAVFILGCYALGCWLEPNRAPARHPERQ